MLTIERIVPDSSVLLEGLVSASLEQGGIKAEKILIHNALVAFLHKSAQENKAKGFVGMDELDRLRKASSRLNFQIEFTGRMPTQLELEHLTLEKVDSLILDLCYDEGVTLFTHNSLQKQIADVRGIPVHFKKFEKTPKPIQLESYFDSTTMSVHLREGVLPSAKQGLPGDWKFSTIGSTLLSREKLQELAREIIENAGVRNDAFIEIERPGSTIVQLGPYRIVITKPPLSDAWEITAVRPITKLSMEDYHLSERLRQRIESQAEGVLIAGAPGMGKSTFAQALAEFYASKLKIVKTIEAPRDLILADTITQYAISHADAQEIHDILLLSRPDYTIFDEMRNTQDFHLFTDLRLAGIGLVGVVHASKPIDAIQRFVGRIELGVIPQVIDTVIFIKNGKPSKVLSIMMTVKVPEGMTEEDLARPIVVVTDFETKKAEYELYSYGEETVVIPVKGATQSPSQKLAQRAIEDEFSLLVKHVRAEMLSDGRVAVYVPERDIARIIGKQGESIEKMEKKLGISIDVRSLTEFKGEAPSLGNSLSFEPRLSKQAVQLILGPEYQDRDVSIYHQRDFVMQAKVGKSGMININRKSKIGKLLADAIVMGEKIEVMG
ncbi:MAG TPA: PINc/VapC family ATPase [Candidatus Nanoarchaeia archaeon]|nr:PINc/VapC family ATPase [Candidatus Nanoarchaeia archaeon]